MAPPRCHLPLHKYQTRKSPCFDCSKYTSEKREATSNFAGWQMGIMSCRNYVWLSYSKLNGVIIWFVLLTDPRMMMYLFYKGKESIKCLQVISLLVLYFKYFHNIIHMLNNVTIYVVKASGRDFYVHIKPRKVSLSWNNVKITHLTVTLIFVAFITGVEWARSIHTVAIDNKIFEKTFLNFLLAHNHFFNIEFGFPQTIQTCAKLRHLIYTYCFKC